METTDLQHFHCPRYEELPSLALYMDQVLILVNEITASLSGATDPVCTATMVNNYVKLKLLEPSEKKKYGRSHVARLLLITLLKNVLSMSETARLLTLLGAQSAPQLVYDRFCEALEGQLRAGFGGAPAEPVGDLLDAAALACASKLALQRLLAEE